MVVLVTGKNGQLGQALQKVAKAHSDIQFVFTDSTTLDITDKDNCQSVFDALKPDFCINTAAYTAVDRAESESDLAYKVNTEGVKNLAESCKKHQTILIHISTDFVFDGGKEVPYTEEDQPNPESVYGKTKLKGEKEVQQLLQKYYIIRTSWVYSEFGNNFFKTMLRLASEKDSLNVVNDQIGTPTNANCLANVLVHILRHSTSGSQPDFGIYHFSNEGSCSWYEFARKIFELKAIDIELNPIPTTAYPTPAIRPRYSVLDKTKIKTIFDLTIKTWEESLKSIIV